MRRAVRIPIVLFLISSLLLASCTPKTLQHKLAIYTANAYTAIGAVTDAVVALEAAGKIKAEASRKAHLLNLKITGAVEIVANRAELGGYKRDDLLVTIGTALTDVRRFIADNVIELDAETRALYEKIAFFLEFTLNSIEAVIAATKEPSIPEAEVKAAATGRGLKAVRAQDTVWTDLVLILQKATIATINQTRLTQAEAFAEGKTLSTALKARLKALAGQ